MSSDWEQTRDRLLHDDFGANGIHPETARQRWADVHAALERVEELEQTLKLQDEQADQVALRAEVAEAKPAKVVEALRAKDADELAKPHMRIDRALAAERGE